MRWVILGVVVLSVTMKHVIAASEVLPLDPTTALCTNIETVTPIALSGQKVEPLPTPENEVSRSGFWYDLGVNLLAGVIQAIVTALLVERWLQRRWLPAKWIVHSNILEAVDQLLFNVVPDNLKVPIRKTYKFGSTTANVTFALVQGANLSDQVSAVLPEEAVAVYELVKENLITTRIKLQNILESNSVVIDAHMLHLVIQLTKALDDFGFVQISLEDEISPAERHEFSLVMHSIAECAFNLHSWLIKHSNGEVIQLQS